MNMKAEFINPFLNATMTVLRTMTSVEPIPGKSFIKKVPRRLGMFRGSSGSRERNVKDERGGGPNHCPG